MTGRETLALLVVGAPAVTALVVLVAPRRFVQPLATTGLLASGLTALATAAVALLDPTTRLVGTWVVLDPAAGVILVAVGVAGLGALVMSPEYLRRHASGLVHADRGPRLYYVALASFWALLAAVPLAGNLGVAWLVLEGTTAFSALLVGFTGSPRALEAGWKYLLLTSLGLGFSLLAIVVLEADAGTTSVASLAWDALAEPARSHDLTVVAYLLLLVGLAAKVGWAPVHNWLPDAHSEAPPPVSALLSGALLPAVAIVAWRSADALAVPAGGSTTRAVLIGFGLASLAVAIPFLWRGLAWKRLLAYSSLEHMGVVAIGIGFGSTLAIAGVVVHIVGHALAKGLGFWAAVPLLAHDPLTGRLPARGIARSAPGLGASMGISLGALSGLPPSPLFVSELLVVAGGLSTGRYWEAAATAMLLALGFLGLAQALVHVVAGPDRGARRRSPVALRTLTGLTIVATSLLLALTVAALYLPTSTLVETLTGGLS